MDKPSQKGLWLLFWFLLTFTGAALGQNFQQYTTFVIDFRSGDVLNVMGGEPRGVVPAAPLKAPYVVRITGEGTAELLGNNGKRPLALQKAADALTFSEPLTAGYLHSVTIFNHWLPKYRGFLCICTRTAYVPPGNLVCSRYVGTAVPIK